MQINLDPSSLTNALQGNKTYITLALGAVVIAANHFGYLPEGMTPANLDPNNWIQDEYKLIIGAVFRSALVKNSPTSPGTKPGGAIGG